MTIVLWASVRSMVRLSLGGYDGLYGYSGTAAEASLPFGIAEPRARVVPARI